ncbi:MAG TPA: sugar phosphate isomerase/epimerase family protein [Bryobacteraceae bacterium]|nr:sugar phosphate isomerase/epimerase family protein [Bryobacteraceae bacterium]
MQGRLLPPVEGKIQAFPRERWEQEFPYAVEAGLNAIEWIYDTYGLGANALETTEGVTGLAALSRKHRIAIRSVCADYFMDFAFVRATDRERAERLQHLEWLLNQAGIVGITRVVLPFVDQSAILDESDFESSVDTLRRALPAAERAGIELHIESSLPPGEFARLLAELPHPLVKVNYDSGNSSSLGYKPSEEFAAYGSRIGSVHIKDRVLHGGTVPLGQGDADLPGVLDCLARVHYAGDIVLQVARGNDGDEVKWAQYNRAFVERYLH